MKADEPRAPIVKFGMSTDQSERMVERHFDLMHEGQQLAAGVLDHNLRTACIVKALLEGQSAPEVPTSPPSPLSVEPISAVPQDWRKKLGLS